MCSGANLNAIGYSLKITSALQQLASRYTWFPAEQPSTLWCSFATFFPALALKTGSKKIAQFDVSHNGEF